MTLQEKLKQEIISMAFCVTGLSFILISFYIIMDKCNLSVMMGMVIGSAASIGNFILNVYTVQHSVKFDKQKASRIILLSKVIRMFLMGFIAYYILLVPLLHDFTGILALFFPQITRAFLYIIKTED